mgnify:FL=1
MSTRVYLAPPLACGQRVQLDSKRAHYLVRVLRMRTGDELRCFDGHGREWAARLADADTRRCVLEIDELVRETCLPPPQHLVQAFIKGDAMDRLLQKATELGMTHAWLVSSSYSQAAGSRIESRLPHWQAVVASACEQSERLWLPNLGTAGRLDTALPTLPGRLIALHPGAPVLDSEDLQHCEGFIVGPEGGWSSGETDRFVAHGIPIRGLGDRVLRSETAPMAAFAVLCQHRGGH